MSTWKTPQKNIKGVMNKDMSMSLAILVLLALQVGLRRGGFASQASARRIAKDSRGEKRRTWGQCSHAAACPSRPVAMLPLGEYRRRAHLPGGGPPSASSASPRGQLSGRETDGTASGRACTA